MPEETIKPKLIEIFYSYASTEDGVDEKLQQQLEKHLGVLKRQGKIAHWHKRNILGGQNYTDEIVKHLNNAQIILLLVSPDFVDSDHCWDIEMERALERQKEEKTLVIPILLRPLDYNKEAPFSNLLVLPKNGKPVTMWDKQDEALADIAHNIRLLAEQFEQNQKISWKDLGNLGIGVSLAVAITVLLTGSTSGTQQSLPKIEKNAYDWYVQGNTLSELKRYSEALQAYGQAIRLDPTNANAYNNKGVALDGLKRYSEALQAYEQAIRLDPTDALAEMGYQGKGIVLDKLKRYSEAKKAYQKAGNLNAMSRSRTTKWVRAGLLLRYFNL